MGFYRFKPGHPDYMEQGWETVQRKFCFQFPEEPLSRFMRKLTGIETLDEFMRTDYYEDEPSGRKKKSDRARRRVGDGR